MNIFLKETGFFHEFLLYKLLDYLYTANGFGKSLEECYQICAGGVVNQQVR